MTTRTCTECGTALAADAHPRRKFCSDLCRYVYRDKQPARLDADADRHRRRYHTDAEHRERKRDASRNRYRRSAGLPLDAPKAPQGRPRLDSPKETP